MSQSRHSSPLSNPPNALYAYAGAFVDELGRSGVRHAVVCPGSRSTPLALTLADGGVIRVWMHIDERSAGFFALGLAKRLGEPVALVCTSGTAAANFLPAVVEANLSHVALLVLTADRPPELRENGAPQTIDQNRLYGAHAKWYAEAALPEATNEALRYIRTLACRAVATAAAAPAAPVHVNFPFREPLTPEPGPLPAFEERDPVAWRGRRDGSGHPIPYVSVEREAVAIVGARDVELVAEALEDAGRGLLVAGPGIHERLAEPLLRLAERLGYPVLADPLSGLRGYPDALASYDAYLRLDGFAGAVEPEVIVRFGAMPTAKPFLQYVRRYPNARHVVVDATGRWEEPTQLATDVVRADPVRLTQALLERLPARPTGRPETSWLSRWRRAERLTRRALAEGIAGFEAAFEGRVFTELAVLLPDGATLVVGNSMPVRDCDTFFWPAGKRICVLGNRGANGIDGVISTALGVAAAQPDTPVVLVVGDLSFYHDLNGLLAAKLHGLNLTIVLVNNDGGGIFSFLPQAAHPAHFEQVFGTPTGLDFAPAVAMYGGHFARATSWGAFGSAVSASLAEGGLRVVEVCTERESNVALHRELWRRVKRALVDDGVPAGEEARS